MAQISARNGVFWLTLIKEHRQLRLGVSRRDVEWPNFRDFIQWVGRAVHERYKSGAPPIILPVGGTETPNFAEKLVDWVREPMDQLWSRRTIREQLRPGVLRPAPPTVSTVRREVLEAKVAQRRWAAPERNADSS